MISDILKKHKNALGVDYHTYHNHAQRVYGYACTLLLIRENKKLAIAAAFHDLDIWATGSMDYLKGSAKMASDYIQGNHQQLLPDEMVFIITHHHRLRPIKGNIEAEAFRKADLIDLTAGLVRYNLPKSIITDKEQTYPRLGFSTNISKKCVSHAIKNPLNPFPMIRF